VAVQPLARELHGFDEYIEGLRPDPHSQINPWFNATWEEVFKCNSSTCDPNPVQGLTHKGGYRQQHYLHFVRDAVYAVASALDVLHKRLCAGQRGLCKEMEHLDEEDFVEALRNITFMGQFCFFLFK